MASQCQGECPERGSEATESKGPFADLSDDGIVVRRCDSCTSCAAQTTRCISVRPITSPPAWPNTTTEVRRASRPPDGLSFLVHSETYRSRAEALARERQIKRWTRAKKEALIAGDVKQLKAL